MRLRGTQGETGGSVVKVKNPALQIRKVLSSRKVKTQHQTDNMNWRVLEQAKLAYL
jgi:hypothetical protein